VSDEIGLLQKRIEDLYKIVLDLIDLNQLDATAGLLPDWFVKDQRKKRSERLRIQG